MPNYIAIEVSNQEVSCLDLRESMLPPVLVSLIHGGGEDGALFRIKVDNTPLHNPNGSEPLDRKGTSIIVAVTKTVTAITNLAGGKYATLQLEIIG